MTIRKLFIANRAEIALRIARTAQRMGIATVVPWHARDRFGPALQVANETVELMGDPPVSAWLNPESLI
jgi:acetyl/propionyl-CoA carboxylase alpha subunit